MTFAPETSVSSLNPLNEHEVGAVASAHKLVADGVTGTRLVGIQGPYYGQTFSLVSRTLVEIGRDAECEIALTNDASVSRNHAKISVDSGRHYLADALSANGTFFNGKRLTADVRAVLSPGDTIRVGDTVLLYE